MGVTTSASAFGNPSNATQKTFGFQFDVDVTNPFYYLTNSAIDRVRGCTTSANPCPPAGVVNSSPVNGSLTVYNPSISQSLVAGNHPKMGSYTTSVVMKGPTNTKAFRYTIYQDMVPGPLPLVGAGVAFGYSRRLRRRARAMA